MQVNSGVRVCPNCGFVNSQSETRCSNCYYDFDASDKVKQTRIRPPGFTLFRAVLICLGISSIGYVLFGGGNWKKEEEVVVVDETWKSEDHTSSAYIMMCDFVREKCRAPGTAAFPDLNTDGGVTVVREKDTSYRITGYVDSVNSFGAVTRSYYSGTVFEVQFAQWKLDNLRMGSLEEMRDSVKTE